MRVVDACTAVRYRWQVFDAISRKDIVGLESPPATARSPGTRTAELCACRAIPSFIGWKFWAGQFSRDLWNGSKPYPNNSPFRCKLYTWHCCGNVELPRLASVCVEFDSKRLRSPNSELSDHFGCCMRLRFCLAVRAHAVLTHRVVSRAGLTRSPLGQDPRPSKRYNIFRTGPQRAPGRPATTWRRSAQTNRAIFWNRALSREISPGSDACRRTRPPRFFCGASKKSARARGEGGGRRGAPRRTTTDAAFF
jgi:hypothetical protein